MHASEEEMRFIEEDYYPEFIGGTRAGTACMDTDEGCLRVDTRWR